MDRVDRTIAPAYCWYVAAVMSAIHFIAIFDRFLMGLLIVPIQQDLALTDTQVGLLQGLAFAFLYALAGVPLGYLADIVNRKRLILAGLLCWSLATAACGLAASMGQLFAAQIAVGLGEAALVPAAMSLLASYFAPEKLGRATSLFTMGATLGKSAAFLGGGILLSSLALRGGLSIPLVGFLKPWQGLFILASLPGLLIALALLTVREPPRKKLMASVRLGEGLSYMARNFGAYGSMMAGTTAMMMVLLVLAAWTVTFFVRRHGLSVAEGGAIVGLVTLCAAPAHLVGGWLTDKLAAKGFSAAPNLVISTALVISIIPAVMFTLADSAALAIASYACLQILITCTAAPSYSGVQIITPDHYKGIAMSVHLCICTLVALSIGPLCVGVFTDRVFDSPDLLHLSLLIVLTSVSAVGAFFCLAGRRKFEAIRSRKMEGRSDHVSIACTN